MTKFLFPTCLQGNGLQSLIDHEDCQKTVNGEH